MKKLTIFLAFLVLTILTFSFKPIFNNVFYLHNSIFSNATYSIYCLNLNESLIKDVTIINNGNGYILKTDINKASYVKQNVSNILGESVSFYSQFNTINKILKLYNVDVKFTENFDNIFIIYGYSQNPEFSQTIMVENFIVNVQIAFNKNILTIGTPIILGEY